MTRQFVSMVSFRDLRSQQRQAILLAALMLALPWAMAPPADLDTEFESNTNPRAWGAGGSNDTGWITLDATGADPANGTFAYADLFLDLSLIHI